MEVWTLTSFTMLRLGSQEAGASRSTRMKRTSFPGTELATCTSQGQGVSFSPLTVPTSPILHAVRCQHSCSPRAAPTTRAVRTQRAQQIWSDQFVLRACVAACVARLG